MERTIHLISNYRLRRRRITMKKSKLKRINYKEKVEFSNLIRNLDSEQLGSIVKVLQEKSPRAIKANDQINWEILVDNINKVTYDILME